MALLFLGTFLTIIVILQSNLWVKIRRWSLQRAKCFLLFPFMLKQDSPNSDSCLEPGTYAPSFLGLDLAICFIQCSFFLLTKVSYYEILFPKRLLLPYGEECSFPFIMIISAIGSLCFYGKETADSHDWIWNRKADQGLKEREGLDAGTIVDTDRLHQGIFVQGGEVD